MYRIIRDNNKKLMALFAVFLMVAFLLPVGFGQGGNPAARHVVATMDGGKRTITAADVDRAKLDWQILTDGTVTTSTMVGQAQLMLRLGDPSPAQWQALMQRQPDAIPAQYVGGWHTFMLLLKEAEAAGITVSDDRVEQEMNAEIIPSPSADAATRARIRQAVRDFLMVEASYARLAGAVKVSKPLYERELTVRSVKAAADVVEIDAAPAGIPTTAAASTTAPSEDALKAQFDKYAATVRDEPTESNPFGFGYRIPDRAKVQTLSIGRDQLKQAVLDARGLQKWELEARMSFYKNPGQFPAPATAPSTSPTTQATAATAPATTAPVARTYDSLSAEEKNELLERVMAPEIASLSGRVRTYLTERLTKDYAAAGPSTQPTTMNATTTATAGYTSYAYLEGVARDVQGRFKVLPSVADRATWLDRNGATGLPGIGFARVAGESFVDMLFGSEPFLGADPSRPGARLQLYEFSAPLTTFEDVHVFRITAAEPNHAPASLAEVRTEVFNDVLLQNASDTAHAVANKLVDTAKSSTLAAVAPAQGRTVIAVGPASLSDPYTPVPGLTLTPQDQFVFLARLRDLLSSPTRDAQGRPIGLIALPSARKVLVVNVTSTPQDPTSIIGTATGPGGTFSRDLALSIYGANQMSAAVNLQRDWFSFEGVSKRIDYKGDRPDPRIQR
jgi:hypothetical protein